MICGIDLIVPTNKGMSISVQLGTFEGYRSFNNNMLYHLEVYWTPDERYDGVFTTPMDSAEGTTIILNEIDKEIVRNAHDCNICADEKPYAFLRFDRVRHNIVMLNMLKAKHMDFMEFIKSLERGICNNYFEIISALKNGDYEVDLANAKIRYWYEQ